MEIRLITPTPCASEKAIEKSALDILDTVRKNKCHQLAVVILMDSDSAESDFMVYQDISDSGEYDLENMIDAIEQLADDVINIADDQDDGYDT